MLEPVSDHTGQFCGGKLPLPIRGTEPALPIRGAEPALPIRGAEPALPIRVGVRCAHSDSVDFKFCFRGSPPPHATHVALKGLVHGNPTTRDGFMPE